MNHDPVPCGYPPPHEVYTYVARMGSKGRPYGEIVKALTTALPPGTAAFRTRAGLKAWLKRDPRGRPVWLRPRDASAMTRIVINSTIDIFSDSDPEERDRIQAMIDKARFDLVDIDAADTAVLVSASVAPLRAISPKIQTNAKGLEDHGLLKCRGELDGVRIYETTDLGSIAASMLLSDEGIGE